MSPRSSGDRAPPSGGGGVGSNPTGGTTFRAPHAGRRAVSRVTLEAHTPLVETVRSVVEVPEPHGARASKPGQVRAEGAAVSRLAGSHLNQPWSPPGGRACRDPVPHRVVEPVETARSLVEVPEPHGASASKPGQVRAEGAAVSRLAGSHLNQRGRHWVVEPVETRSPTRVVEPVEIARLLVEVRGSVSDPASKPPSARHRGFEARRLAPQPAGAAQPDAVSSRGPAGRPCGRRSRAGVPAPRWGTPRWRHPHCRSSRRARSP